MFQKLILVGNLGADPAMRYLPSGQAVTNFSIATNRRYTDSTGAKVDETVWFRIATWGKLAETCNQYLSKGSRVLVEGRLTADEHGGPRIWTADNGQPRASFEVSATNVQFLSATVKEPAPEDAPF